MSDFKKIFRDPIYDLIVFDKKVDKVLLEIIDSPEFQRLRRIRQLGLAYYTYSSALHDRFSHSIGVCYMTGILIDHLKIPNEEIEIFSKKGKVKIKKPQLKLLLQIAGLLHDIGHGPFSHAFERITKIDHEYLTKEIIKSKTNSISKILENIEDDILKEYAIEWIVDIIDGDFRPLWIKELISSQLDSDRMDYLQRDSYMCGVSYSHFDWKWIFENMEIRVKVSEDGGTNERLVINGKKGVYSLESFIISRYHMHEQVYYHKTTRGFEGIVRKIFERIDFLIQKNLISKSDFIDLKLFSFLEERIKNKKSLQNFNLNFYLNLDDFIMLTQFKNWSDESTDGILKELCSCLINRKQFKMIHDGDTKLNYAIMKRINEELGDENFKYFFFEDDPKSLIYKDTYVSGGDPKEHIWLVEEDGEFKDLSAYSELIKTITNRSFKKERAYCHPEFKDKIIKILN